MKDIRIEIRKFKNSTEIIKKQEFRCEQYHELEQILFFRFRGTVSKLTKSSGSGQKSPTVITVSCTVEGEPKVRSNESEMDRLKSITVQKSESSHQYRWGMQN